MPLGTGYILGGTGITPPPGMKAPPVRKIWNLESTDLPSYDDMLKRPEYFRERRGIMGRIEYLTPQRYMILAAQLHGVAPEREYEMLEEDLVSKFADRMAIGEIFPVPVLDFVKKEQEGRHRVAAAARIGETYVPVFTVRGIIETKPTLSPATEKQYKVGDMVVFQWEFGNSDFSVDPITRKDIYPDHFKHDIRELKGKVTKADYRKFHSLMVVTPDGLAYSLAPYNIKENLTQTQRNDDSGARHREGEEIAQQLGNGVVYNGPQYLKDEFVAHVFTDQQVTGTTFLCRDLEGCKMKLSEKRALFSAAPPKFEEQNQKIIKRFPLGEVPEDLERETKVPHAPFPVLKGSQVVRTSRKYDEAVKHLGYESVDLLPGAVLPPGVMTDAQLIDESQARLLAVQVVPDSKLSESQKAHLTLARAITDNVAGGVKSVLPAIIPPASDRVRTAGMYGRTNKEIYIALEQLNRGRDTVDTAIHEAAHFTSDAEDGQEAHKHEMTRIAGEVVAKTGRGDFDKAISSAAFNW